MNDKDRDKASENNLPSPRGLPSFRVGAVDVVGVDDVGRRGGEDGGRDRRRESGGHEEVKTSRGVYHRLGASGKIAIQVRVVRTTERLRSACWIPVQLNE